MSDLDPLLREAMARVKGPVDVRPSVSDVHRRARRHNRRRMAATAGALACTGVATTALIIRRDSADRAVTGQSGALDAVAPDATASTIYQPEMGATTTTMLGLPDMTIRSSSVWDALWNARYDPAGALLGIEPIDQAAADVMPTPEQFGCTSEECRAMYNYVVWHEIALTLGFSDVRAMQAANPTIDFSTPPREGDVLQTAYSDTVVSPTSTTTIEGIPISVAASIVLIDGGAPAGAMDDALGRLSGYNPMIAPPIGRSFGQSMLMPIEDHDYIAQSVGSLLGIDGFDMWDPSLLPGPTEGITAAVVIGPDYWDRIQYVSSATTTTLPGTTTTSTG